MGPKEEKSNIKACECSYVSVCSVKIKSENNGGNIK